MKLKTTFGPFQNWSHDLVCPAGAANSGSFLPLLYRVAEFLEKRYMNTMYYYYLTANELMS